MKEILKTLKEIIEQRGLLAKKELLLRLKDNEEAINAFNLAFNPYIITGIAEKKLNKTVEIAPIQQTGRKSLLGNMTKPEVIDIDLSFKGLVDYFDEHHTGTDNDIKNIQTYINKCIKEHNLDMIETSILQDIITKSLTLGIAVKSINDTLGKIIPTFNCMLGSKLDDCKKELNNQEVVVTEKLDGNRCLTIIQDCYNQQTNDYTREIHSFSRNGKEIEGLDSIHYAMRDLPEGVYDGELLASDFNATQSTLRTKGVKDNLIYNIFDYVASIKEFLDDDIVETSADYNLRRERLNDIFRMFGDKDELLTINTYIKLVPVLGKFIYDEETVMSYHDMIKSKGGEGVMLNITSAGYIKDRTKKLVKVKAMKSCDLICKGIEQGTGRLENTLGNIICEYKGYEVKVGSGFDDASREYYFNNPDKIVNHLVEVQYFEETTNDNGTVSLRFPVFLRVRDDKDEESYN